MIELNVTQGSAEWHALRATHDCASEAAAALGLSKNCTRSELMKIKHTGITPDVSEWTQKFLFDKGHEVEAMARPIVEKSLGEDLFPVTVESDNGKLLASLDGFTMLGGTVWENKLLNPVLRDFIVENNDLPDTHWPQCEHQILVTGAGRVYFTVSDGTEEGTTGIFYESRPERRQRLIAGWAQFNEDLASYELPEVKLAAVAEKIESLPALFMQVEGRIVASNMDAFKSAAEIFLSRLPKASQLQTDQDFANADQAAKDCKDAEDKLQIVKAQAQSQAVSIDEAFRAIDGISEKIRAARILLEKAVKAEKENRKAEIVNAARQNLFEHLQLLRERVGGYLPTVDGNFGEAIKGLKSLDSVRDKVSVALANAKIEANSIADRIEANKRQLIETDAMSLFPDFATVCTKLPEDFDALLAVRTAKRKADEAKRLEAERERIRAEEQASARREAEQKAQMAEHDRLVAERLAAEAKTDIPVCVEESAKSETQTPLPATNEAQPEVVQPITNASARDSDRTWPRVTSLRIQISNALDQMNVFELASVLAYCQALPLKSKLAA